MKFICGNCRGTIREGNFSRHIRSWVPHTECGHETLFAEHVPGRDKGEPKALRIREAGDSGEGFDVGKLPERREVPRTGGVIDKIGDKTNAIIRECDGLPSAKDLDLVAEEQKIAEATASKPEPATTRGRGRK